MFKNLIKSIFSVPVSAVKKARSASGEFLLKKTDYGIVRVEFSVIKKISERALRSIKGIKEWELSVEKLSEANPFRIKLTTILVEGYSAPRVSETIDKTINNALKEFLKLEFYVPVDVRVREIAQVVTKKRRVR